MRAQIDPQLSIECHDFDFLIGRWEATIVRPERGDPPLQGTWSAQHLHEGRIVVDDLVILDPDGRIVRSMATLRTWVREQRMWAATFLYASEPLPLVELLGRRHGDEILLEARNLGAGPTVSVRFLAIDDSSFEWEQRNPDETVAVHIACTRVE